MTQRHKNRCSQLAVIEEVIQGDLDTTGYAVQYANGRYIGVVEVRTRACVMNSPLLSIADLGSSQHV